MSRSVSSVLKQAVYAQETGTAFLLLLTLSHSELSQPIRVSSDGVDTVSRSDTYIAFPFNLSLPDDTDDRPPRARLAIDNVDRQIVQALRQVSTSEPISVLMEIVLSSDPNTVEASFPDFKLKHTRYDANVVEGELTQEAFLEEPYPARIFSPADFPGLF